ncbi:MAG: hypothetical protein GXP55_25375 [Deltaproteobacteria bacterium]|nr:hypothetical protein [Deltaproteobacteria bacterium]
MKRHTDFKFKARHSLLCCLICAAPWLVACGDDTGEELVCDKSLDECEEDLDCFSGDTCNLTTCLCEDLPCSVARGAECDDSAPCAADAVCNPSSCTCDAPRVCSTTAGDECAADTDCGSGQVCTALCACACPEAAECRRNMDCASGSCVACACEPVAGTSIPANTTDCTLDAVGCLVGGDSTCKVTLDAPIVGSGVTVQVDGVLLTSPASSAIGIWGFALPGDFEPAGYHCAVDRSDTSATASLTDTSGLQQGNSSWTTAAADYPVSATCSYDSAATQASLGVTGASAPAAPIESATMGAPAGDKIVITLWRATACNIVVTTP